MAPSQSSRRLVWEGVPTVRQLAANLQSGTRTVLQLPRAFHPVLSAALYGGVPRRGRVDVTGDAGLLACLAEIDGLRELGQLVAPAQAAGARLRLRSPAPYIVFNVATLARRRRAAKPALQYGEPWATRPEPVLCGGRGVVRGQSAPALQHR